MIDLHPPEHTVHTWRDFFIHIATICVGLLIAIGLEQSVEAIHRQHERAELRESLNRESHLIVRNCERLDAAMAAESAWEDQVEILVLASARTHRTIPAIPPVPLGAFNYDTPVDSVYLAAKASNKLELLSQQETEAYGELDFTVDTTAIASQRHRDAAFNISQTLRAGAIDSPGMSPGLKPNVFMTNLQNITLSPASLAEFYKAIVRAQGDRSQLLFAARYARGAATALLQGERDLPKIQAAERQFNNLP
ncbi:MAG: hypothetical protein WBY53_04440 [Acidobacteriaceae bacterium]